ncbi:phage holin family protein [Aquabacterium sp.]|uniref:phage holin family protein n=1 Tax=Aquabacterium sp. TaxID=1872578 RepID=UPI0019C0D86B|nr:phage holin family protein [Aquabacterium sp.]MBC7701100.1 phage holin family protein [Aquabacterium sp.]
MAESTTPSTSPGGLLSSLRGLMATLLAIFQTRLALLATELEEEKLRLLKVLAWGAVALLLGGMGLLFAAAFITVLFWDEHRLLALGLMAAFFVLACMVAVSRANAHWQAATGLLSATLAELDHDRRALMPTGQADHQDDEAP